MLCNYCDTPNPEGAVYCKHCGRRLDGMALCSFCGSLTPADGDFCVRCGSNRNAPVYFMKERATASAVGEPRGRREEKLPSAPRERGEVSARAIAQPALREKRRSIFSLISLICGALSALAAFVFTFLIGTQLGLGAGGVSTGVDLGGYDIFYFFGEAYQSNPLLGMDNTIGAVCGTVASVLALGGTAACFILTYIRFTKVLRKQTQKSVLPYAAATFAAYAAGTALFSLCATMGTEIVGVSTSMALNGATIAGIVICAVLLVAAVVFAALAEGIPAGVPGYIFHTMCKGCGAVFALVALAVVGSGVAFVKISSVDGAYSYGILELFSALLGVYDLDNPDFVAAYNGCLALSVVTFVAAVAAGVFIVLSIVKNFHSWSGDCTQKGNIFGIVGGVCSIAAGVGACVCSSVYAQFLGEAYSANVLCPVFVIVFGVLACAVAIVNAALSKKFASKAE